MNFNWIAIIRFIAPLLGVAGVNAHSVAERVITVPKRERLKLYQGMSEEDIEEAEALYRKHADATSDWLVYVASRGEIEAD